MKFFRRIAGFLGFGKDEQHEVRDVDDEEVNANVDRVETHLPRKGFSVPVQVAVDRAQVGPVLIASGVGDGGVQGLKWYARQLRIDEDGDVADEFLDEVSPETLSTTEDNHQKLPRFEVKYSIRPAKVRNQVLSVNGKIQQSVEHEGRVQWVV